MRRAFSHSRELGLRVLDLGASPLERDVEGLPA
jgi:hypothetical protein